MFIILFVSTILTLSARTPSAAHGASDFAVITNTSSSSMAEESLRQHNTQTFPPINSKSAWFGSGLCNMSKRVDQLKNSPLLLLPGVITSLSSSSSTQQVSQERGMKQSRISLLPLHGSNDWHHSSYDGFKCCCWFLCTKLLSPQTSQWIS